MRLSLHDPQLGIWEYFHHAFRPILDWATLPRPSWTRQRTELIDDDIWRPTGPIRRWRPHMPCWAEDNEAKAELAESSRLNPSRHLNQVVAPLSEHTAADRRSAQSRDAGGVNDIRAGDIGWANGCRPPK